MYSRFANWSVTVVVGETGISRFANNCFCSGTHTSFITFSIHVHTYTDSNFVQKLFDKKCFDETCSTKRYGPVLHDKPEHVTIQQLLRDKLNNLNSLINSFL